jgi:hypothetical protein
LKSFEVSFPGLFAGFSVLSIIEFFYFFTLRLATDLLRWLRARKAQAFE